MIRAVAIVAAIAFSASSAAAEQWTPYGYTCGDIVSAKETQDFKAALDAGMGYVYMLGQTHQAAIRGGKQITRQTTAMAVEAVMERCMDGRFSSEMSIIEMGDRAGEAAVAALDDL